MHLIRSLAYSILNPLIFIEIFYENVFDVNAYSTRNLYLKFLFETVAFFFIRSQYARSSR